MKIKDGYMLRKIADTNIVVPVAERVIEFKGMMVLNQVSAGIWTFLEEERSYGEVVDYLLSKYEIDRETVIRDLDEFLKEMGERGIVDFHE